VAIHRKVACRIWYPNNKPVQFLRCDDLTSKPGPAIHPTDMTLNQIFGRDFWRSTGHACLLSNLLLLDLPRETPTYKPAEHAVHVNKQHTVC
jgi:hypothetical protein